MPARAHKPYELLLPFGGSALNEQFVGLFSNISEANSVDRQTVTTLSPVIKSQIVQERKTEIQAVNWVFTTYLVS